MPSSTSSSLPGSSAAKTSGCGSGARAVLVADALRIEIEGENRLARRELDPAAGEIAQPHLRPLQIGEDADGPPGIGLDAADIAEQGAVVVMRPVAEIAAEHVDPGIEQRVQPFQARTCRPERGDDLGAALPPHRMAFRLRVRAAGSGSAGAAGVEPRMARKSLTLVSVGPVTTRSPRAREKIKNVGVVFGASAALTATPRLCGPARAMLSGYRIAPALSSVPSIPSVSQAIAAMPSARPRRAPRRADSRNSLLRPAAAVAVHRDRGFAARQQHRRQRHRYRRRRESGRRASCSAIAACTRPISRASPSIRSLSTMIGATSRRQRRIGGGGERLLPRLAINSYKRAAREHQVAGLRRLVRGGFEHGAITAAGSADAVFSEHRTGIREAGRVGYCGAGCDNRRVVARHIGDCQRARSLAGALAACGEPPAGLIAERCFRTALISPIVAPERSSARVTACLSARLRPGAGRASRAEPPPEIRQTSWSSRPRPSASSRMRRAACSPLASGTGWLASTISMRSHATAWPCRVTTRPLSSPGHRRSKARAIAAEALPAPTTTVRPGNRRPAGAAAIALRAPGRRRSERRVEHEAAAQELAAKLAPDSLANSLANSLGRDAIARFHVSIPSCQSRRHFISSASERPALDRASRQRARREVCAGNRTAGRGDPPLCSC